MPTETMTPGRRRLPSTYARDPRSIMDLTSKNKIIKAERRRMAKKKFDKEEGRNLVLLKRWEKDLEKMKIEGGDNSTNEWLSQADQEDWMKEARSCKEEAEEFLDPANKTVLSVERDATMTKVEGEDDEFARNAAIDLNTTKEVEEGYVESDPRFVSSDRLGNVTLFKATTETYRKLMSHQLPEQTSPSSETKLPQLYNMSWPVIANEFEQEKFIDENALLKRKILHARGKLPAHMIDGDNYETPYALGQTPKYARSGGKIEPSFYNIDRNENPFRLPNSTFNFWQKNAKLAPVSSDIGLNVTSFSLPEFNNPNDNDFELENSTKPGNEISIGNCEEGDEMGLEGEMVLDELINRSLGKGLYHDETASLIAAPLRMESVVEQRQPMGFAEEKPKLRILEVTDALQWQGEQSPRSRLHNFKMFPYVSDAHEAAFIIQRFWGRHTRKRLKAALKFQAHFRKMRTRREFIAFVQEVRRAKKAIGEGLGEYLKYTRAKKDAVLCVDYLTDEVTEDMLQGIIDEMQLKEKCRIAFVTLLCRYRWKRRISKRRRREAQLREYMSVRCQRGARFYLVKRMMVRWLRSHKVIKRSFRAYFYRKNKKHLRRIMGAWRNYWLRYHVKLIQRIWRGIMGRALTERVKLKLTAVEGIRAAKEGQCVAQMLEIVDKEMEKHLKTKEGKKEVRGRGKECKLRFNHNMKKLSSQGGLDDFSVLFLSWASMYEVAIDESDRVKSETDGFIDIKSLDLLLRDISVERYVNLYPPKKGDDGKGTVEKGEEEEMIPEKEANFYVMRPKEIAEFNVHGTGHVKSEHVLKWIKISKLTDWAAEGGGDVNIRDDIIFGAGKDQDAGEEGVGEVEKGEKKKVKIITSMKRAIKSKTIRLKTTVAHKLSGEAYFRAGMANLIQSEKKRHWEEVIAAFRGGEEGGKPRVECEGCLRAFPFCTKEAQEHVLKGGCVKRPKEKGLRLVDVN